MKLTTLALIATLFHVNAKNVYGQKTKVTFELHNVELERVLEKIEKLTDFKFIYKDRDINYKQIVSVIAKKENVSSVLKKIFYDTNISFELLKRQIILKTKPLDKKKQQNRIISGKISDKNGAPIAGVTIAFLSGDKVVGGTTTDFDGGFSTQIGNNITHLRFSAIGFENQTIPVTEINEYNLTLADSLEELEEVIITGYQEIKRDRMTGATNTIKAADVESRGYTQIDEALEASIPGLSFISSGRPGEDAQISIRGINSLNGNTQPEWIVDGMPLQGTLPNINVNGVELQNTLFTTGIGNISPSDIKSITVLKDAAATAIYGSRAANGVIVIETKSGIVGKTAFNFSATSGITSKPKKNIDFMNSSQKIQYERDLYNDIGRFNHKGRVYDLMRAVNFASITLEEAESQMAQLSQINTDWFDEVFRTGYLNQYSMSMQGGNPETQYYASLNFNSEKGIIPQNKNERLGLNIKITNNPIKNLRIIAGLNATLRKDRATASSVSPLEYVLYANPYEKPYNADGSYASDLSYNVEDSRLRDGELEWGKFNILHDLNNNISTSRYIDARATLQLQWQIKPTLMFQTNFVYNINSNNSQTIEGKDTYTNFKNNWLTPYTSQGEVFHSDVLGSLRESTAYSDAYTFRNTLQYNEEFNGKHFVSAFLGQEISKRDTNNAFTYAPIYDEAHGTIGFPTLSSDLDPNDINFFSLGGTGVNIDKASSFFGNASYSYMDKYVVSGSLRYDGSSIVGNENQFTPLWNVAGRYNLHNETFLENLSFIDMLSLRVSYGFTGSIDKSALPYNIIYYDNFLNYDNQTVPTRFNYANPNIKWQTKRDRSLGLDLRLFNKIDLTVNYYNNLTFDLLELRGLSLSSGVSALRSNVADVVNRGWEFSLSTTNISTPNFRWSTRFNVAINHNEITSTEYKNLEELPFNDGNGFVQGYPVRASYGFKFAGIDPNTGHTLVYQENGDTFDLDRLSDVTLNELPPEMSYLGEGLPPIVGGVSTRFTYKQFSLTASADFKVGHTIPSFDTNRPVDSRNRHITDGSRWRQPGDITNIPGYNGYNNDAFRQYQFDVNLEKGDYARLNLLSLGYEMNPEIIKPLGFNRVRFNLNARNLFTLTKYRGIDPSLLGKVGYPNSASYNFSLNLNF